MGGFSPPLPPRSRSAVETSPGEICEAKSGRPAGNRPLAEAARNIPPILRGPDRWVCRDAATVDALQTDRCPAPGLNTGGGLRARGSASVFCLVSWLPER